MEVPTYVTGILTMESGALVNLTISFDMQFAYWDSDMPYLTIYGSKGSLNVPDMNKFEGPVTVRRGDAPAEEVPVNSPTPKTAAALVWPIWPMPCRPAKLTARPLNFRCM